LFEGATPQSPVRNMFSFTPCLPAEGNAPRFARPNIELPGLINPSSVQTPAGANHPRTVEVVEEAWRCVVNQVFEAGLHLATEIQLASAASVAQGTAVSGHGEG
jgi:hypothetical protein